MVSIKLILNNWVLLLTWIFFINISFLSAQYGSSCSKTLNSCEMQVKNLGALQKPNGPKGEMGDPGFNGLRGDTGDKGDSFAIIKGEKGELGPPGYMGVKGEKGTIGPQGEPGLPGITGTPGQKGRPGDKIDGEASPPGPIGPPGPPGDDSVCGCTDSLDDPYTAVSGSVNFASHDEPGSVLCKDAPVLIKSGIYTMNPENKFNVLCENRKKATTLTCLPPTGKATRRHTFTTTEKKWLGETLENIYGVTRDQLSWLQKRSNAANQTIRYHCDNSSPFPRDAVEKSLLLLGWNDAVIGPMPTESKPFYYHVPTETDGCSARGSTFNYTDIIIVSEAFPRVPVVDFLIGEYVWDESKHRSVAIEHIQLCFD